MDSKVPSQAILKLEVGMQMIVILEDFLVWRQQQSPRFGVPTFGCKATS